MFKAPAPEDPSPQKGTTTVTINATTSQPVTPVEELREAARLMRERAEKVDKGPWAAHTPSGVDDRPAVVGAAGYGIPASFWSTDLAEHVAGADPTTMLAVAGWLDCVAIDDEWESESAPRIRERTAALSVARVYLGGTR